MPLRSQAGGNGITGFAFGLADPMTQILNSRVQGCVRAARVLPLRGSRGGHHGRAGLELAIRSWLMLWRRLLLRCELLRHCQAAPVVQNEVESGKPAATGPVWHTNGTCPAVAGDRAPAGRWPDGVQRLAEGEVCEFTT